MLLDIFNNPNAGANCVVACLADALFSRHAIFPLLLSLGRKDCVTRQKSVCDARGRLTLTLRVTVRRSAPSLFGDQFSPFILKIKKRKKKCFSATQVGPYKENCGLVLKDGPRPRTPYRGHSFSLCGPPSR